MEYQAVSSKYVTLNDGHQMPRVGLGTFQGKYDYSVVNELVISSVKTAIDLGYRHIDTAQVYNTEEPIGIALAEKLKEGAVTRDQLYITTKLWNTYHRRDRVVPSLRKSLEVMGLDYVDQFLIHWPCAMRPGEEMWPKDENGAFAFEDDITDYIDTWKGMVECKELGLAKSIGVSNFTIKQLSRILEMDTLKPSNMQIEVNPFFLNEELVQFAKRNNIQISCFSPLHKPNRHWALPTDPFIVTDETLNAIAKKYNKTPQQVALRFQLQRGLVVVPKSSSAEHLKDNINIFDFELNQEELESIRINCGKHNNRVLMMKTDDERIVGCIKGISFYAVRRFDGEFRSIEFSKKLYENL